MARNWCIGRCLVHEASELQRSAQGGRPIKSICDNKTHGDPRPRPDFLKLPSIVIPNATELNAFQIRRIRSWRRRNGQNSSVAVSATGLLLILAAPSPDLAAVDSARHSPSMSQSSTVVSIHPYFKVHPGKLDAFKASLPKFIEITRRETKCLYYDFTINDYEVFCREGYVDAEGVLTHLENVGALLGEALKIADLTRLELHGPAGELDKLKGPLTALNPAWFAFECGVKK